MTHGRNAHVAATGREFFGDQIWEGALNLAEGVHAHVQVDVRLYRAPKSPSCNN